MGRVMIPVEIASLKLRSPVVLSSGCVEYSPSVSDIVPFSKIGAIITKTVTLRECPGNPMPRTSEVDFGLINSIGLQNKGLDDYLGRILPQIRESLDCRIITSISGFTIEEFANIAAAVDKEDAVSAIEVNISCPNLEKDSEGGSAIFAQDEHMSYGVIKAVRESSSKPVIAKLSPDVTDIRSVAQAVSDAGADAITVANTYSAMAIDIYTRKPKIAKVSGGLSGPAIRPLTLKRVWDVYNTVDLPIIASGGIMDYKDGLEYIIAGAALLSIGTANFINPGVAEEVAEGIESYLRERGIEYKDLIGSLKIG
ncbi:MAG: dihydroorotate dehydrogenase [Candidatus Kaelpia imicola]|nr:dihydroorotate dehydrogenase [Candidatus Kaelpia imicola]